MDSWWCVAVVVGVQARVLPAAAVFRVRAFLACGSDCVLGASLSSPLRIASFVRDSLWSTPLKSLSSAVALWLEQTGCSTQSQLALPENSAARASDGGARRKDGTRAAREHISK